MSISIYHANIYSSWPYLLHRTNCRIVFGPIPDSSDADSGDDDARAALNLNNLHLVRWHRHVCTEKSKLFT